LYIEATRWLLIAQACRPYHRRRGCESESQYSRQQTVNCGKSAFHGLQAPVIHIRLFCWFKPAWRREIYLARMFSGSTIQAFEPHPVHLKQLAANLAANGLANRVTVHPVAAGCEETIMSLTDEESMSKLSRNDSNLQVRVVDWLEFAAAQRIDLLKMDIEGGEYDLLFDPRFASLNNSLHRSRMASIR
jgi:FkbM family methyltransferase